MKKSLFGIFAAALCVTMSFSATMANAKLPEKLPDGFTVSEEDNVAINGANDALAGWQHYFNGAIGPDGSSRGTMYEDHNLALKATTQGHTGNAMHFERKSSVGDFVTYSYFMGVKPNQNYYVQAYVKAENAEGAKLIFSIQERAGDAANRYTTNTQELNKAGTEVANFDTDAEDGWKKIGFNYSSSSTALDARIKIQALGVGDMYVDDITVHESNAAVNTVSFRGQSIGTTATDSATPATDVIGSGGEANMHALTDYNISDQSSDNDGASLHLRDRDVFKTNFPAIASSDKQYRLSFKYKVLGEGSENRISIRMNYALEQNGEQQYWINPVLTQGDWESYSFDFYGLGGEGVFSLAILSYADCLIDELSIICLDTDFCNIQFITNGSFSGAYLDEYFIGGNSNVAKQSDGTYAFTLMNTIFDAENSGSRGYISLINGDKLTSGKTYKLSFDYYFSGAAWVEKLAMINGTENKMMDVATAENGSWIRKEFEFTSNGKDDDIKIYGPSYYYWNCMIKNFSIVDEEGNEYITNKTLVSPGMILGEENIFNYGTFEGDVNYKQTSDDWTFEGNAYVYGLKFELLYESPTYTETTYKGDWKIILKSKDGAPAAAVSKEITAKTSTVKIYEKMYFGNVKTTLLVGDTEIEGNADDVFELPEGTESFRIKFTGLGEYAAFKYVYVLGHTHDAAPSDESGYKVTEATCTQNGGKCYTCTTCGYDVYVEKTNALGHNYEEKHLDATCKDGYDKKVCSRCGDEKDVTVIPATGEHDYETVVDKEATCSQTGMTHEECEICGARGNTSIIPKLEHHFENGTCTVCGATDPDYKPADSSQGGDAKDSSSTVEEPVEKGCNSSLGGGEVALFATALLAVGYIFKKKEN